MTLQLPLQQQQQQQQLQLLSKNKHQLLHSNLEETTNPTLTDPENPLFFKFNNPMTWLHLFKGSFLSCWEIVILGSYMLLDKDGCFYIPPADGYAHSIMISAFCRSELFEEAKQLAKDFEAKFDKYDLVLLNTMLCAYCRAGEMESVMHVMKKMDELAISPDYNTFHTLIKYFCKEKLYLLAYRTMVDMHSKGYQPEEVE
ncbi:hypothetical protein Pint_31641 [Pistacia integerrima]|uniref:Uncharacterized protein n=1 Tax=Pistacia integerrima TaxID=434235 RepID=A0ACC0XTM4_9ROSI|nr:hypothetical protein Pint_31641 [Pistacia integerrima]